MSVYVVGDLQGCLKPLKQLLAKVDFKPQHDQLYLVGDLINRGPESLATLRFLYQLDQDYNCIKTVLGNHDLHLLACAFTQREPKRSDTLAEIINANDSQTLLQWLRQQPLALHLQHLNEQYLIVHAGIHPEWGLEKTLSLSLEVCNFIQSDKYLDYFNKMYGNTPENWSDKLSGIDRLRAITNYLTRIRYCEADGKLDLKNKLAPENLEPNSRLQPWFNFTQIKDYTLLFGHWASLQGHCPIDNIYALDTGFVWGGELTMLRLDDKQLYTQGQT